MKSLRRLLLVVFLISVWSATVSTVVAQDQDQGDDASDQPLETPSMAQHAPPPPSGARMDRQNQQGPNQQDGEEAQDDNNDPPGRVARLQYMNGSVSIQPHGTDDWVEGAVNRPLTNADNVWADKNSRGELNLGTGIFRLGAESSLTLTNVNENTVQVTLHQGTVNLHVRHLFDGETYEIDSPNQAFTISRTGDYRVDVDPNGDATVVTVWQGEGVATGDGPAVRVKAHVQARFTNGTSLTAHMNGAPNPDSFDEWCESRDRRADNSQSSRYVSPDVIGSEDLDDNGTWQDTEQYGHVWVPRGVDSDWAPYTNGNWIYQDPWGWTWQDYSPWGFAPFHYGRWVSFGGYWGWAPGPYYGGWARSWYAPALVSWYGGGFGVGIGFGGGFGWCPLGFGEPFFPWYRHGWGYFRSVNIYNSRFHNFDRFHSGFNNGFRNGNWRQRSVNMNARGGFHAVSRSTMERGLAVNRNSIRVNQGALRNAQPLNHVSLSPSRESRLGGRAGVRGAPQRSFARPTVSASSRVNNRGSFGNDARPSPSHSVGRGPMNSPGERNVPRPQGNINRSSVENSNRGNFGRNNDSSIGSRSNPRSEGSNVGRGSGNVPRPTGRVLPSPRSYSSDSGRGNYSARSYGDSGRGYQAQRSGGYSRPSYGGGSGYSRPSYGGGNPGYSRPSYGGSRGGAPSGGGYSGHSSPAPSRSSGGGGGGFHGGGGSAPSSHGSSGGGGGGHSSGGGGGGGHNGHR